ncbi:MAG: hypothetical protein MZV70_53255 [Desulfobacterales bacterium]|nr:hypothetical protein [Desulfobacterales bacterium]
MLIIDGLSFDDPLRDSLAGLKHYARLNGMSAWFTIRTHRHENPGPGGIPKQLVDVEDLFEVALQLVPVGEEIHVKVLKGSDAAGRARPPGAGPLHHAGEGPQRLTARRRLIARQSLHGRRTALKPSSGSPIGAVFFYLAVRRHRRRCRCARRWRPDRLSAGSWRPRR